MLFILAEKHDQERDYVRALKGQVTHVNRYIDEVDNSTIRPDKPKIFLSYLQGHAYELKNPKEYDPKWKHWALKYLPIFPKTFTHRLSPSFIKSSGGRKHMEALNRIVKKCDEMWLGSDPDVEGEGLIYEPIDINHWDKQIKIAGRIWITHGLTPRGLAKTFRHDVIDPAKTKSRAVASHSREMADWLIGMNISRLATNIASKYGYQGTFSAGRVQTPTLALIAKRRKQRQNFKPVTTYRLAFKDKNSLNYLGNTVDEDGKTKKASFTKKDDALTVARTLSSTPEITNVKNQKRHKSAPKLPKTNDMQGYLIKHAHITAKQSANEVLEPMYDRYSAQTYPRTECNLITTDDFQSLLDKLPQYKHLYEQIIGKKIPDSLFTNKKPRKKYVDFTGEKIQKQGHGAITPDPNNEVMSYEKFQSLDRPKQVDYRYVLGCTLAMFADDHAYQELEVNAKADKYTFKAHEKTDLPNEVDWQQLFPKTINADDNKYRKLPVSDYHEGGNLAPIDDNKYQDGYYAKNETTSAPSAITEANLTKTVMPKYKLGTSSTRANIIDSLKNTKLIISSKKKSKSDNLSRHEFMPTKKGIILLELMKYSHLLNLSKVSSWENQINQIIDKKVSHQQFLQGIKHDISDDIEKMPKHEYHFSILPTKKKAMFSHIQKQPTDVTCPKCHKGKITLLKMDMTKNGKTFPISFYTCSQGHCTFSVGTSLSGLKINADVLEKIIKGTLPFQNLYSYRKKKHFKATLYYGKGKIRYKFPSWFDETYDIKCPKCHKGKIGLITGKSKRTGKPYALYKCTNCKFTQFRTVAGVKLTPTMIKQACKGKMPFVQFTSRNNKSFEATLAYSRGKLKMKFKD